MIRSYDCKQNYVQNDEGSSPTCIELTPNTSLPAQTTSTTQETFNCYPESNTAILTEPSNAVSCQASRFNASLAELDFEPTNFTKSVVSAPESNENNQEEAVSDEEEEVTVKYPYQKPDMFEDLIERVSTRLKAGELDAPAEIDAKLKEAVKKVIQEQEEQQMMKQRFAYKSEILYTCAYCSKCFKNAENLKQHLIKHDTTEKKFKCTECRTSFKHKKNLEAHLQLHFDKPELPCKECSFVFRSSISLEAHMQRQHGLNSQEQDVEKVDMVQCRTCAQQIPSATLKRHSYYCANKEQILKKRAEQKTASVPPSPALSVSSVVSLGAVPITSPTVSVKDKSCPVCGLVTASRQSLLRHISRKHKEHAENEHVTAVRYVSVESDTHQYACKECGKRLTTRAALTLHQDRVHKKTKRFECEVCHKAYPLPSELRKHIKRVHNNTLKENIEVIEEQPANSESLIDIVF